LLCAALQGKPPVRAEIFAQGMRTQKTKNEKVIKKEPGYSPAACFSAL
jgi:hypothetical protein